MSETHTSQTMNQTSIPKPLSLPGATKEIFGFFFKQELKAKRTKVLFIISSIPFILLLIAKLIEMSNPAARVVTDKMFSRMVLYTYIQYLIPILGLMFGSKIINEEMDRKTLVFLTTCPIPKTSVILGKYLAYALISILIINIGLFLCFMTINLNHLDQFLYVKEVTGFAFAGFMALVTYMALFTFLGAVMKKSIILGLLFIFLWEAGVQYFPGVTQKLTVSHFVKSLLPVTQDNQGFFKILAHRLEPTSPTGAIITMLVMIALGIGLACYIFKKKEYPITDAV